MGGASAVESLRSTGLTCLFFLEKKIKIVYFTITVEKVVVLMTVVLVVTVVTLVTVVPVVTGDYSDSIKKIVT